jgi:transcription elongation GreA/GreB family factor
VSLPPAIAELRAPDNRRRLTHDRPRAAQRFPNGRAAALMVRGGATLLLREADREPALVWRIVSSPSAAAHASKRAPG